MQHKKQILDKIKLNFGNTHDLYREFCSHPGYNKIEIKDFLPMDTVKAMASELDAIPVDQCKKFTRLGSCMYEYNNLDQTPMQDEVVQTLHSSTFINWLEKITNSSNLIPDPHLMGAGYSKAFTGDSLKLHTDFNWNDSLKLHRRMSLIIYLNERWDTSWGGSLDFYDSSRENLLSSVVPGPGNMVIWDYNELAYHGYPDPMVNPPNTCRKNIRLFYYTSKIKYSDAQEPHRSLYWFDQEKKIPYDKPWIK